jgi:dienelactone hydrolase
VIDGHLEAYLAVPPKSIESQKIGILYIPDILGIWQNSKLMADLFAAQGYTCLVLDIFNGDPAPLEMPEDFDIMGWLSHGSNGNNPHTPEAIDPIILKGVAHLKSLGLARICAVGYCLGAKVRPTQQLLPLTIIFPVASHY